MSKWGKFAKGNSTQEGNNDITPVPTFSLRQVIKTNGEFRLEQLVEYKNKANQVIQTEWVEIPTIYEG